MASTSLQPGTLLNQRYNILEVVGQGGMGTVYKAEHARLHVIVAVKEIRGTNLEGAEKRQDLEACEHEAQFLVKLNHPNLPKVTDAFIENDNFYLVMQFIEGVTLDTKLSATGGAPVDVLQGVEWGLQLADVLAYLHSQEPPVVFRDLKPSNVMVQPDGSIKLIDFGIARHFQPGASKDTSLLGSVGYSPPEQFGRGQTDPRSDVYAFGATLHHLLTGRDPALQPFKFAPARSLNLQIPDSLSNLLEMCLALEPKDRPQSINVAAVQLLRAREELVQRRAQAVAQQAALNAVGRSLAGSLEPASGGMVPRVHALDTAVATSAKAGGNAERNPPKVEPPRPAIKVTTASAAKAKPPVSEEGRLFSWPVLLVVTLLVGGGAMLAILPRHSGSQHISASSPIVAPPVQIPAATPTANPEPIPPTTPEPTTSGSNTGAPLTPNTPLMPPPNDNVSLQTALLPATNDMLPIAISGTVKGQMGETMQVGVYFFDARGMPISAIDANPMYINAQRYLCVYKTLNVNAAEYPVHETLSVPMQLLSGVTQPGPFTYQVILFLSGKPVGETPRVPLPVAAYNPNPASVPAASGEKLSTTHVRGMSEGGN